MFNNTLTLTVNTVPYIMTRINQDNYGSEYTYVSAIESIVMKIRHTVEKQPKVGPTMKRHNVYVERNIFATNTVPAKAQSVTVTLRGGSAESPAAAAGMATGVFALLDPTMILGIAIGDN